MKKLFLLAIALFFAVHAAWAQDTIDNQDSIYVIVEPNIESLMYLPPTAADDANRAFYYEYYPLLSHGLLGDTGWFRLQMIDSIDSGIVYGIAFTAENFPQGTAEREEMAPIMALYNHQQTIPVTECENPRNGYFSRIITLVDSATIYGMQRKRVYRFDQNPYLPGISQPQVYATCTEFYFDTPHRIEDLTDSFYVGVVWAGQRAARYRRWMADKNVSQWFWPYYPAIPPHIPFDNCRLFSPFNQCSAYYLVDETLDVDSIRIPLISQWTSGSIYPIMGLRCSAPKVRVVEKHDGGVTVSWRQGDAGDVFQVALGRYDDGPDSASLLVTTDTFYTSSSHEQNTVMGIWVRKACRYTTAGYDTTVWSGWSQPAIFRTVGIGEIADGDDFSVNPNPASSTVSITLPQSIAGATLELCDLAGRTLSVHPLSGTHLSLDISRLPAGTYLLKLVSPRGISTRRLIVGS